MTFFGSKIFWSLPNVVKRTLVSQSFDYILAHIKMTCIRSVMKWGVAFIIHRAFLAILKEPGPPLI